MCMPNLGVPPAWFHTTGQLAINLLIQGFVGLKLVTRNNLAIGYQHVHQQSEIYSIVYLLLFRNIYIGSGHAAY